MNLQPLFSDVHAGAPHPTDELGEMFDLAAYIIKNPDQTFFVRVAGSSMSGDGINDGDLLLVDSSIAPQPSDIVVAETPSGYTVKRFQKTHGHLRLVPSNPAYQSIDVTPETRVCGVAKFAIKRL